MSRGIDYVFMVVFSLFFLLACQNETVISENQKNSEVELHPMDAVLAAPNSHDVLIDNERVRVLRVKINPGEKEPMHNHLWESVMYVDRPAKIRYYNDKDEMVFESNDENFSYEVGDPSWMGVEGIHAVENIDTVEFSAIRVELK